MVLSNRQIIEEHERGHVVIEPFAYENVRLASVDLTLGKYFYRADAGQGGVYNPFDKDSVRAHFAGPFMAKPYFNVWRKLIEENGMPILERWPIPEDDRVKVMLNLHVSTPITFEQSLPVGLPGIPHHHPVIMLLPGERILAHTHEFAGIRPPGTSKIYARSTWGRSGISVCLCAGLGDPGFVNRWTLEITNFNPRAAVPLPLGERIAQLQLLETGEVSDSYGSERGYESKYQEESAFDLPEIMASWRPEMMLPRSYKDQRKLPLPLMMVARSGGT